MSYKQAKDAGLLTGGTGGGDVFLAGTNTFTGTNTFNVICPQSTIVPEVASDLCNKAYVDAGGDVTLAGTNTHIISQSGKHDHSTLYLYPYNTGTTMIQVLRPNTTNTNEGTHTHTTDAENYTDVFSVSPITMTLLPCIKY